MYWSQLGPNEFSADAEMTPDEPAARAGAGRIHGA
jgi:hypothetical protein